MGQLSIFDYMPVRHPCGRPCQYEWGSLRCFEERGYIRDRVNRKWVKDDKGRPLIGKKKCDYEPQKE